MASSIGEKTYWHDLAKDLFKDLIPAHLDNPIVVLPCKCQRCSQSDGGAVE